MSVATNPFNGEKIAEYDPLTEEQMRGRIGQAKNAFPAWRNTSFAERGKVLKAVALELRKRKSVIASLMATEMGKPVSEGGPEVEKAAWCAEYYAEHAEAFLAAELLPSDASRSYVCYQPLGALLGILPWNAPLWLAFRYLAPALMAGNTCVMKHDPNVPACAQVIADAFVAAGAPDHIMVNLPIETPMVEAAIRDHRIAAVSFTGSATAGAKVAAVAGSEIKPCVLELGGSDPFIVLADADLDAAADIAVLSRMINAGQSCIAAKRLLVAEAVMDVFLPMLQSRLQALEMGDPQDPKTQIGPLARRDLQVNLHRQVRESIAAGAGCLLGGELPAGPGYFYPATLLTGVTPGMTVFREETFGPVMAVTAVSGIDEAVALANDSDYGLGAGLWTADVQQAERWALCIDVGQVAINGIVKTDPRLPSGGIKRSGYGRELGPHGIKEFVNAKQVWLR